MSGRAMVEKDTFDINKAIAAISYLVEKTGAQMYSLMKMMYLADKVHLERYGRFIAGDNYVAMKQGPVPSRTYNMIKHVGGVQDCGRGFESAKNYLSYDSSSFSVGVKATPDYDELSESDVECLDQIADVYNNMGQWAVRDMSHDNAWKSVWGRIRLSKSIPMGMEVIAAEFDDEEALVEHLRDSTPGEAAIPEKAAPRKTSM